MHQSPPLPEEMTTSMLARLFPTLHRRECDVLLCLARALSNQEIADALYISIDTVEKHVRHIVKRCGWKSRAVAQREVYRAFILQARGERG